MVTRVPGVHKTTMESSGKGWPGEGGPVANPLAIMRYWWLTGITPPSEVN